MNKNNYRQAKMLNFFRYFGDALFAAFLPLFFKSLDLSSVETGTLLASVPFMAIVGNIVIGLLSKNPKRNLNLMRILAPIEAVEVALIAFFSQFYVVLLFSLLIFFCNSSSFSLLESISSHIASETNKNYIKMRLFGSVAYLISSFFGGTLIHLIDYRFTFLFSAGLYLIAFIILFFIKLDEGEKSPSSSNFKTLCSLLKNKTFIGYLVFYLLVIGASAVTDNFFALFAKDSGVTESSYGMIYSMMIAFEIGSMLLVIWLKIKNYKMLLLISAAFIIARDVLLCFQLPKFMLYILPAFRGIGWGVMLAAHLNTLKSFLGEAKMSSAIFGVTIALQLFNTVLNQIGPLIIDKTSYAVLFAILSGLAAAGFFVLLFTKLKKAKNTAEEKRSD